MRRIWRAFDALQPEPLYQDFICIEAGGLGGRRAERPLSRVRQHRQSLGLLGRVPDIFASARSWPKGRPVVRETMDFDAFKAKYFRFWNVEDLPTDNTFDKYQKAYFREKRFDVDVKDGQLNLEFQGENWACSVSAVVIFPVAKAAAGGSVSQIHGSPAAILFRQLLQARSSGTERASRLRADRGRPKPRLRRVPARFMQDVSYNDTPKKQEIVDRVHGRGIRRRIRAGDGGAACRCATWARFT